MIEAMGQYNEERVSAGVLVAGEGLEEAEEGAVVEYRRRRRASPTGRTARRRSCSAGTTSRGGLEGGGGRVGEAAADDPAGNKMEMRRVPSFAGPEDNP